MANEDKATRYHRLRRQAGLTSTALGAVVLVLLLVTGWSASLRGSAAEVAAGSFFLTVVVYVALLALLVEVVQLPLAWMIVTALKRGSRMRCRRSTPSTR